LISSGGCVKTGSHRVLDISDPEAGMISKLLARPRRSGRRRGFSVVILAAVFWGAACVPRTENAADLVLMNAHVYAADAAGTRAEAVAVRGGRIVFVGTTREAGFRIGPATRVWDLGGRSVLPGFIDSHAHPVGAAEALFGVVLTGLDSAAAYQKAVAAFVRAHPDARSVRGAGWSNTLFPKTGPPRGLLDAAVKDIPVVLSSEDGHSVWVNSKALELAGVDDKTPDPKGGVIEREPKTRRPAGTLREHAASLVAGILPDFTQHELELGLEAYQRMALALGITTAHDASIEAGGHEPAAYRALEKSGRMAMRFRASLHVDPARGPEQLRALSAERARNTGALFQTNTAKIFVDGVVEGVTAYLLEPYAHRPGFRGEPLWKLETLKAMCTALSKEGFQLHFHAIGDAAVAQALDAVAFAETAAGRRDQRPLLTHLQLVAFPDIARFKSLAAVAVPQPYWFIKDDYYYRLQVPYLGLERADREYPMESFFKAGVVTASSSDFPVTVPPNPLEGIRAGVTRLKPGVEDPREILWPEERATLEQMIASFTREGAYANFLEAETGTIELGKSADLIVLDRDLFAAPPPEIAHARVLLTLFRGRVAFRDPAFRMN
jgi:predicted amidohydrolase YtcJ